MDATKPVYSAVYPDIESRLRLDEFMSTLPLIEPQKPEKLHATTVYTKTPCPELYEYKYQLPVSAVPSGFKVFPGWKEGKTMQKVLVLVLESPDLEKIWQDCMNMGATWSYPEFIPHISLGTVDENTSLDFTVPTFQINFDRFTMEPVDKKAR